MNSRPAPFEPPPHEKPQQRWTLLISCRPMITRDYSELLDVGSVTAPETAAPLALLRLHVQYDDRMLYQGPVTHEMAITELLLDDKDQTKHHLRLWITGKVDSHSWQDSGSDYTLALAGEIAAEGLPVTHLDMGDKLLVFGQNNQIKTLEISTPIYRWLVQHQDKIYSIT